jgi:phage baseplate assembly protein gpV
MGTGGGGTPPSGEAPSGGTMPSDGAAPSNGAASSESASSTTYDTVRDYIDHLNSDGAWVDYDASSGKATVLSLAGFVTSQKPPTKDVGAFDSIDRSATENVVLGLGEDGLHFAEVSDDVIAANQDRYATLSGWDAAYGADQYASDFAESDDAGQDVLTRVDAYNPMYFLSDHYDGYQSSNVAPHWRIRTGIMQGDTASTIEINLALALANLGIKNVDFATVWGQAHTMAERTGDATTNFIAWVTERVGG